VPSRPARPGETLIIYGVGFGDVTPSIPAGQLVPHANTVLAPLELFIGGVKASLAYSGLVPGNIGLYQFNVAVPDIPASDLVPLTFTLSGIPAAQNLYLAVQTGN
jgi:uncharacterized protein (TIGR03437 family)